MKCFFFVLVFQNNPLDIETIISATFSLVEAPLKFLFWFGKTLHLF